MDGCVGCNDLKHGNGECQLFEKGNGRIVRRIQFPTFTLTENNCSPGAFLPPHTHASCSICVTLAGSGLEMREGRTDEMSAGTVLIRPANEVHTNRYGPEGARSLMLEISHKSVADDLAAKVFARPMLVREGIIPTLALRIYQESRINDSAAQVVIEGLFLELLGNAARMFTRPSVRQPPWLKMARDLCHAHFNDSLNLFQIATAVGVHPTHLARSFRRHYRTTVGDYIRRLRLDWATQRLTETDESIAAIAYAAGFYDQSHFTHSFKQQVGVSPAEFRATVLKADK